MVNDRRVSRKEREKKRHAEEILHAAEAVFAEKGYSKARMSDIAAEAEFSVGYLYHLWESKKDLYLSLLEVKNREFKSFLAGRIRESRDPLEKIDVLIDSHFRYIDENKDFFKIYMSETAQAEVHLYSTVGKRLLRSHGNYLRFVEGIFADGIRDGFFISIAPQDLTLALKGMIFAFAKDFLKRSPEVDFKSRAEVMKRIFFDSILKGKGKKRGGKGA